MASSPPADAKRRPKNTHVIYSRGSQSLTPGYHRSPLRGCNLHLLFFHPPFDVEATFLLAIFRVQFDLAQAAGPVGQGVELLAAFVGTDRLIQHDLAEEQLLEAMH